MQVRLRLSRFGRKRNPLYNIIAIGQKKGRDKLPIDVIGTFNPMVHPPEGKDPRLIKEIKLDFTKARYWVGVGASPSDAVGRILSKAGILPPSWPGPQKTKAKLPLEKLRDETKGLVSHIKNKEREVLAKKAHLHKKF